MKILVCSNCNTPYLDTNKKCPNCGSLNMEFHKESRSSFNGIMDSLRKSLHFLDLAIYKCFLVLLSIFICLYTYVYWGNSNIGIISHCAILIVAVLLLSSVFRKTKFKDHYLIILLCGYFLFETKLVYEDFDYDIVMYGETNYPPLIVNVLTLISLFAASSIALKTKNKRMMIVPLLLMIVAFVELVKL